MKYDLSIGTGQELNAKELNKRSKRWLVKRVQWLQLLNKQMVTDHAMALNKLKAELGEIRKKYECEQAARVKAEDTLSARQIVLQKSVSDNHNKQQIIRKLGDSLALAGEAIAHL